MRVSMPDVLTRVVYCNSYTALSHTNAYEEAKAYNMHRLQAELTPPRA